MKFISYPLLEYEELKNQNERIAKFWFSRKKLDFNLKQIDFGKVYYVVSDDFYFGLNKKNICYLIKEDDNSTSGSKLKYREEILDP